MGGDIQNFWQRGRTFMGGTWHFIGELVFYSSFRFVFETAVTSKQIEENSFEALLDINDKFITNFNVFRYMILQFRLKTVCKISKAYCMTLKTVAR